MLSHDTETRSYGSRMATSVLAGLTGMVWARITGIVAVALLVRTLGVPLYGVWAITDLLMTSQGLVDLGVLSATVKFTADAESRGDLAAVRPILRMSLLWYTGLGVVFAVAILASAPALPRWIGVAAGDHAQAETFLVGTAFLFTLSNYAYTLGSALQGLQSAALVNAVYAVSRLPYLALLGVTTVRGYGALGVVCATAVMYGLQVALLAVLLRRRLPPSEAVAAQPLNVRAFLTFGSQAYVAGFADFCVLQAPKLVATGLMGATGAARVDLAYRLPVIASGISYPVQVSVVPGASRLVARDRAGELPRLTALVTRYLATAALPLFAFTAVCGPALLGIWAGGAGRGLDGPVRVLAAAFAVGTLSAGITAVLTGMGRPGDAARYKVVLMVTTIACTGVFGAARGLEGIAEGAAAAQLVAILYLVCGPVANLGAHVRSELLRSLERPAAALVVASACGALAAVALRAGDAWTWSAAAVTLALYPVALLAVGGVTANDLRLLGYPARWNPPGVRTGAGG